MNLHLLLVHLLALSMGHLLPLLPHHPSTTPTYLLSKLLMTKMKHQCMGMHLMAVITLCWTWTSHATKT
jgi:hypothetical protein